MIVSEFLSKLKSRCLKINYEKMASEWHPYREWCNPPRRGRFAAYRLDGKGRDYHVDDRTIIIVWKWPSVGVECDNPPQSTDCISFQNIGGSQEYPSFPDGDCLEALNKLPKPLVLAGFTLSSDPEYVGPFEPYDIQGRLWLKQDVTNDGIIDLSDMVTVSSAIGSRPGDPEWSEQYDLNNNGVVDREDLDIVIDARDVDYGNDGIIIMTWSKDHWATLDESLWPTSDETGVYKDEAPMCVGGEPGVLYLLAGAYLGQ